VVGGRQTAGMLAGAAALAVIVLILAPGGVIGWCVMAPAIVTLISTGLRMMLSLREAQEIAEALRLSLSDEVTGLPNRRSLMGAIDGAADGWLPAGSGAAEPGRVQGRQ